MILLNILTVVIEFIFISEPAKSVYYFRALENINCLRDFYIYFHFSGRSCLNKWQMVKYLNQAFKYINIPPKNVLINDCLVFFFFFNLLFLSLQIFLFCFVINLYAIDIFFYYKLLLLFYICYSSLKHTFRSLYVW